MSAPLARLLTNSNENIEVFVEFTQFLKTLAKRRVMYCAEI